METKFSTHIPFPFRIECTFSDELNDAMECAPNYIFYKKMYSRNRTVSLRLCLPGEGGFLFIFIVISVTSNSMNTIVSVMVIIIIVIIFVIVSWSS